jgi:hypothetical protein
MINKSNIKQGTKAEGYLKISGHASIETPDNKEQRPKIRRKNKHDH